jgi:hypothetical protein
MTLKASITASTTEEIVTGIGKLSTRQSNGTGTACQRVARVLVKEKGPKSKRGSIFIAQLGYIRPFHMHINGLRLLVFLALTGCTSRERSTYRYGDICVTRVDEPGHSYFYWGNSTDPTSPPSVSVDYHEYGSSLDGYMVFNPDKSVTIIGVMGLYLTTDSTHPLTIKAPPNEQFIPWRDSIDSRYQNVVRLKSEEAVERRENLANKSAVQVSPRE